MRSTTIPSATSPSRKPPSPSIQRMPRPYLNLGLLYQIQYKQDLAVEYFLKALSLDPRLAAAHVSLGTRLRSARAKQRKPGSTRASRPSWETTSSLKQLERYQ